MRESKTTEPIWLDKIAIAVGRPWVFVLTAIFVFTPSYWLLAALNSGAAFLKIGTGARPAAMGGAYTAMADDVNALYYNPGGLAQLEKRELGATHMEWLLDTKFDFLGYAHPTKMGTFALGMTRLSSGKVEGRDADRRTTGDFTTSDTAYTVSFSRRLRSEFLSGFGGMNVGANLKLLRSTIGGYSAQTQAIDLGAQYRYAGSPLSLGISVLNIGPGMRFLEQRDPLPLTFAVGGAYRLGGILNLAMDVRREVHDNRTDVGVGTEYAFMSNFSLRMGYASQYAKAAGGGGGLSSLGGIGAGLGINTKRYRADYTFTPFGDLGNAHRISLGSRF